LDVAADQRSSATVGRGATVVAAADRDPARLARPTTSPPCLAFHPMTYRLHMVTTRDVAIRPAETDADLEAWIEVRQLVIPTESAPTVALLRAEAGPGRLVVLAESGGRIVGSGLADRSQVTGSFVAPRILPEYRRRGLGSAVLAHLIGYLTARGFSSVGGHVVDDDALAFATRHGFVEVDRQVQQVRAITTSEPVAPPYPGVEFATVAERPKLLQRAYPIAVQGYADMVLRTGSATVPLDEWLAEEATLPAGSFVALDHGSIVGYAGLVAWNGDSRRAENGLTVVERRWRGRGLATALKRRQLAWAAQNGIREISTWTQQGNEAMQRVNAGLGYDTRSVSRTMRRDLP
jgi:mycothiol synthase